MDLECRHVVIGGHGVLLVRGELDLATVPQFRDHLTRAAASSDGGTLYVDIDGLSALDDTGFGVLLGTAARLREQGGNLVIVCTADRLRARLRLTGMDRAIKVVATATS